MKMSNNSNENNRLRSVCSNIRETEEIIHGLFFRIETIEKNLKSKYLSDDEREKLEKELEDVKQIVVKNETELKNLYSENTKSFTLAVIIMFFGFLFYGLYVMIFGHSK